MRELRTLRGRLLLIFLWSVCTPFLARASSLPTHFAETRLADGLDPTGMEFAPDGRLFLTEKHGAVRIIKNGALLSTPFLTVAVNNDNERGLQKIVFDPSFTTNHYVYIYYTTASSPIHNRVSRFTANGDVVIAGSELPILDLETLNAGNHNGGGMVFSNGKLLVSTGENAVPNNAQSMTTRLGKVLRINTDGTIPTDNPFYNTATGVYRAIYALGFRNPFKLNAQRTTGKIYVNDVGQSTWEEINELVAGKNYGWPTIEGFRTDETPPANYKDPVFAYDHNDDNCSITGGAFYNPQTTQFPSSYTGTYFYMDYCAGKIYNLNAAGTASTTFASGLVGPVDVQIGSDGSLYYYQRGGGSNTSSNVGSVWRVRYTTSTAPSISAQPADQTVSVGETVSFTVSASGSGLGYQWQRNGANISGATGSTYTLTAAKTDSGARFACVVTNTGGSVASRAALLKVTSNKLPTAAITSPANHAKYTAGTTISFSGTGSDPEDGSNLPAADFSWLVVFHHDAHTHPGPIPTLAANGRSGTFNIPNSGETSANVWYRLFLTVTDSDGGSYTDSIDVNPTVVTIALATSPANLQLTFDGQAHTTPYSRQAVVGMVIGLSAPSPQTFNSKNYTFSSWSPAVSGSTITVPSANTTYTATYTQSGSTDPIISGETYFIQMKHSGLYVGVAGASATSGAAVEQEASSAATSQQWVIRSLGSGLYSFQNVNSGKFMDVTGASSASGAKLHQWTSTGRSNQQFTLVDAGSGYYKLMPHQSTNKCLEVPAGATATGTQLDQATCSTAAYQQFKFIQSDPDARRGLADESTFSYLSLYPNPARDQVTLQGAPATSVTLLDRLGRRVLLTTTDEQGTISLSNLSSGIYLLQAQIEGKLVTKRLVVALR